MKQSLYLRILIFKIMKKVVLLFAVLLGLQLSFTSVYAQNKKVEKKNEQGMKKEDKKEAKAESKNPKLKKDGTPDMRYKENQEAAKAQPPLKKDGTPDKRFQQNKEAKK